MKETRKIRGLVVRPEMEPVVEDVDTSLQGLQSLVGGWIECFYPFDDDVVIVLNEEGKLIPLAPNRPLLDTDGTLVDVLYGTFVMFCNGEEDFEPITDELAEKYTQYFKDCEETMEKKAMRDERNAYRQV